MNILLIEDHPGLGKALKRKLEMIGHRVELCVSVDEFFQVEPEDFEAIITDFNLGDDTGLTVLQGLEGLGSTVPVLLHTSADTYTVDGMTIPISNLAEPGTWSFPFALGDKMEPKMPYIDEFLTRIG